MRKPFSLLIVLTLSMMAAQAWGGMTQGPNLNRDTKYDTADGHGCGTSKCLGMPTYSFKSLVAGLNLEDTPIGYTPPVGPAIKNTLTYNQRDIAQPTTFDSYNLGRKWTISWLSYIQDDPQDPGYRVTRYVSGGGTETYGGYNPSTGTFTVERDNGAHLVRTSSDPITYELRYPNGKKEIFSVSDGKTSYPRKIFLSKIIDPQGNTVTLSYDSRLRLTAVTDAIGQKTTFQYGNTSNPSLVTGITGPFGRTAKITYDGQGRLDSITDEIGLKTTFAYAGNGTFIDSMTTPYGTTTFKQTKGVGNRSELSIQATDPLGYTERTEYRIAAPGVPFSVARAPSSMTTFDAYLNYRDSFYWDKDAYAKGCHEDGGTVVCNYSLARMKHFEHKYPCCVYTSHTLQNIKYPLEGMIWFDYAGQPGVIYPGTLDKPRHIGRVLPNGRTQLYTYAYNAYGNVTKKIDPAGRETLYTYAPNGIDLTEVRQKNASGGYDVLARYTYNGQHEPLTYTNEAGGTTTFTYNPRGQVTSVTDPLGHKMTYNYDQNGYLVNVVNALGHVQRSYTYDAYGRLASSTDSRGYTLRYSYDALNRLTQITYPDGSTQTYTWNKLDLVSFTDRLGHTTRFTYDADRNLIKMTDPLGQVTRYTYYPNGRLHTLTDPDGNTTTWTRDLEGRVIAKTYADGNKTDYVYDNANRLISKTDALGQITNYAYTIADRLSGISYENVQHPTPSVSFAYGSAYPRLDAMTDGHGTTTYQYYPAGVLGAGRLESLQGPDTHDSIQYAYDALGRVSKQTVDGAPETFSYDAINRLTGDNSPLGDFTTAYLGDTDQPTLRTIAGVPYRVAYHYESNLNDRRLKAILNRLVVGKHRPPQPVIDYSFTSNDDGLFTSRAERGDFNEGLHLGWAHAPHWGASPDGKTSPGSSLSNQARTADGQARSNDLNVDTELTPNQSGVGDFRGGAVTRYSYDAALRLTGVNGPRNRQDYAYDPAGNLLQIDRNGTSTSFSVNDLNQIQASNSNNFVYNADGELLDDGINTYTWDAAGHLLSITNKQTGHNSAFTYDGLGRRVTDTETGASGTSVTTTFLWCGLHLCEKRSANDSAVTRYFPQGQVQNGQPLYYAQDQVGSVTALVNAQGTVVGRLKYDAYGNIVKQSGILPDFRYAGLYYQTGSGLYLATLRAYDSMTGRWLSRDPLREIGGINQYAYVNGNPVVGVDPHGLLKIRAYLGKGAGNGNQWYYTFQFNPLSITDLPGWGGKIRKLANYLHIFEVMVEPKPVGPKHPVQDYFKACNLDRQLLKAYRNAGYLSGEQLTGTEATRLLNEMFSSYPEMQQLYNNPAVMLNEARNAGKSNFWNQLNMQTPLGDAR